MKVSLVADLRTNMFFVFLWLMGQHGNDGSFKCYEAFVMEFGRQKRRDFAKIFRKKNLKNNRDKN